VFKQKTAIFNWTLFALFICILIRYHNAREVATHKIRNTVTQEEGYDRQAQQWNERAYSICICQVCLSGFMQFVAVSRLSGRSSLCLRAMNTASKSRRKWFLVAPVGDSISGSTVLYFTAAKGATFLQSVYEPVFATGG